MADITMSTPNKVKIIKTIEEFPEEAKEGEIVYFNKDKHIYLNQLTN